MTEKAKSSPLGAALGVGVFLFAAMFARGFLKAYLERPDVRSQEFLSKVAAEVNKKVPVKVDDETELTKAFALDGVLVYNYKLVNLDSSQVSRDDILSKLKPDVVRKVCATPETRDKLLAKGVALRYSYAGKDRVQIGSFDVASGDCGS